MTSEAFEHLGKKGNLMCINVICQGYFKPLTHKVCTKRIQGCYESKAIFHIVNTAITAFLTNLPAFIFGLLQAIVMKTTCIYLTSS